MYHFDLELTTKSGNVYSVEVEVDKHKDFGKTYTEILSYNISDDNGNDVEDTHEDFDEVMELIESSDYEVERETSWDSFFVEDDITF